VSAPTYLVAKIRLSNDEGWLRILYEPSQGNYEKPSANAIRVLSLKKVILSHEDCGLINLTLIPGCKKVVFCPHCGLRLSVPSRTNAVGQLKRALESK